MGTGAGSGGRWWHRLRVDAAFAILSGNMEDPGIDRGGEDPVAERQRLERLVYGACVAAVWSDGVMTLAERDYVSHLLDQMQTTPEERTELRRQALHGTNANLVLGQIASLGQDDRRWLFERCVDVLRADRRINRSELRYLEELRRPCGIGWWTFLRYQVRLRPWRNLFAIFGAVLLIGLALVAGTVAVPGEWPEAQPSSERVLLVPAVAVDEELPPEEVFDRVRRSVVTVRVLADGRLRASGSGVVIGADRRQSCYLVTNRHVVRPAGPPGGAVAYRVEAEDGRIFPARLDFVSSVHDLALLRVDRLGEQAGPVPLSRRGELRVGQPVYAIGAPEGYRHTFTSGVISALRPDRIQTDATVDVGSSGGPLFDCRARVCGVITEAHPRKDLSFALYTESILQALEERARAIAPDNVS